MDSFKIIDAEQAKIVNNCNNDRRKLRKTNVAIRMFQYDSQDISVNSRVQTQPAIRITY
jgi:hypothetical protein